MEELMKGPRGASDAPLNRDHTGNRLQPLRDFALGVRGNERVEIAEHRLHVSAQRKTSVTRMSI
jgi:hypothetical protein